MYLRGKFLLRVFARASLGFVLGVAVASPAKANADSTGSAAAVKRQSASAQFARAEEQRAALNSKPGEKRTLSDYKQEIGRAHV
jgi:hypothetical protein